MSAEVRLVTRAEARRLLLKRWAHAMKVAKKLGRPYPLPNWKTTPSFELEYLLALEFGVRRGAWVIVEASAARTVQGATA